MRNIKLFEDFSSRESESRGSGEYAVCISTDFGWNAVGALYPGDEKYINELEGQEGIYIEKIPFSSQGDFIVLDGQGMDPMWKLVKDGDTYNSNDGYVFPIVYGKFFVAMASGHTVDYDLVKPRDLANL